MQRAHYNAAVYILPPLETTSRKRAANSIALGSSRRRLFPESPTSACSESLAVASSASDVKKRPLKFRPDWSEQFSSQLPKRTLSFLIPRPSYRIDMFQFYSADGPKFGEEAAEIEQYRARHRRIYRGQQPDATPNPQVEDLDVEHGRTRKVSAKWRQQQQQQQVPVNNQFGVGTELHLGFNAFDFSASPEAFFETEQQQQMENQAPSPSCPGNQQLEQQRQQGVEHGTNIKNVSLWERRSPGLQHPGATTRQLPTLGQDALWGGPVHYATHDAQRRTLYYQPQYYA